jgi:integrase
MRINDLARSVVGDITAHGLSKRELDELNASAVRSIGTERAYREVYRQYLQWLSDLRLPLESAHTRRMMLEFLDDYAEFHKQKSVNRAVQALQKIFSVELPPVESCIIPTVEGRAYSFSGISKVITRQKPRNIVSTLACFDGGLRAHECYTLRKPRGNDGPSGHRNWSNDRFLGRTDYVIYLTDGKGGLVREVALSLEVSTELEKYLRPEPVVIRDREIEYISHYEIGGGQALSASFSYASKRALGYSHGLHGTRHSFAWNRLAVLIPLVGPRRALEILAEELGHFRGAAVTLSYLVGG